MRAALASRPADPVAKMGSCPSGYNTSGDYGTPGVRSPHMDPFLMATLIMAVLHPGFFVLEPLKRCHCPQRRPALRTPLRVDAKHATQEHQPPNPTPSRSRDGTGTTRRRTRDEGGTTPE